MSAARLANGARHNDDPESGWPASAKIDCPVVGMITGNGMIEGGPVGWLDENKNKELRFLIYLKFIKCFQQLIEALVRLMMI